jgi:hypothetical protein
VDVVTYPLPLKKAASPSVSAKLLGRRNVQFPDPSLAPKLPKGYRKKVVGGHARHGAAREEEGAQRNHWHGGVAPHIPSSFVVGWKGSLTPSRHFPFATRIEAGEGSADQIAVCVAWPMDPSEQDDSHIPCSRPPTRACRAVRCGACTSTPPPRDADAGPWAGRGSPERKRVCVCLDVSPFLTRTDKLHRCMDGWMQCSRSRAGPARARARISLAKATVCCCLQEEDKSKRTSYSTCHCVPLPPTTTASPPPCTTLYAHRSGIKVKATGVLASARPRICDAAQEHGNTI